MHSSGHPALQMACSRRVTYRDRGAERHCLALAPNHGNFPLFPAAQVFELSYMVYFNRCILCTAPLTLTRFQPLYQAIASAVFKHSCNHSGVAAFHFGITAKPVVLERHLSNLAVFLRILHNKIFPLTVLLSPADRWSQHHPRSI